jgi:hypothetical protein
MSTRLSIGVALIINEIVKVANVLEVEPELLRLSPVPDQD